MQRAREQAEIEYWRAVEARARSWRMTPDTEVHRKRKSALQEEDQIMSGGPSPHTYRRPAAKKNGERISPDIRHPDSLESKKSRSRKMKGINAKPLTASYSRAGNKRPGPTTMN
jgi:hypothetical protein